MVRRAILIACMVAPLAIIAWAMLRGRSPALKPTSAASIISSTREFNRTGSLVAVPYTFRVDDSMGERYYAEFTLREHGTAITTQAKGEFKYWSGNWHLRWFQYGKYPEVKTVEITSDVPPPEEFSK
jgi:hypothetical protein